MRKGKVIGAIILSVIALTVTVVLWPNNSIKSISETVDIALPEGTVLEHYSKHGFHGDGDTLEKRIVIR